MKNKTIYVSGNLYYKYSYGEEYLIVENPNTNQSQGIIIKHINPEDLRKYADYLEKERE